MKNLTQIMYEQMEYRKQQERDVLKNNGIMTHQKKEKSNMKKIILAIALMTVGASADGIYLDTALSYGKVQATEGSSSFDTKSIGLKQEVGYRVGDFQANGYVRLDKYKEDVIADTEGNAISYGIGAGYISDSLFAGISYGKGSKDLGSDGAAVGSADFRDITMSVGLVLPQESMNLKVGIENINRNYDSFYGININERITSLFVAANF